MMSIGFLLVVLCLVALVVFFGFVTLWAWMDMKAKTAERLESSSADRLRQLERDVAELKQMVYDAVIEKSDQERLATPVLPGQQINA
ncbi:MAG: hypothetical protein IT204_09220 [Fimbriimonadaceae bacterium]|nr:hypothetical protein [Fimbriimonadaceae bacterium]